MVGITLQRGSWRYALRRPLLPCSPRTHSQWHASVAERRKRAEATRIETLTAKWQPLWDKLDPKWHELRKSDRGKAYVLPMFPYPSGRLHLGHLRVYTISDVLARYRHMQGYKVLHPFGWDAFGLPAENAAIERGVHPEKWTLQNIDSMKAQIKEMGGRWDWDTEIRTCDPDFYKHTQRIFLMLHERGLAYQAESLVNYDPVDKTVLANEQVDANGCSWRSGAKVEKLMLKQWFLKIKEFQEPLLKDLDALAENGRWPEKVLAMQRNWIGRSEGAQLRFDIQNTTGSTKFQPVDVFTTRADTLFGVQYLALSLKHPIVQQIAASNPSLQDFIEQAKDLPSDTKEGFCLPNISALNPISNLSPTTDASIPIYAAPYVLDDYGSGAVMGVPGHDTRDHAFWRANVGSAPIKVVVATEPGTSPQPLIPGRDDDCAITERGFVSSHIDGFAGLPSNEAARKVVSSLQEAGKSAETMSTWRLRDWLISRQRYWGAPIPIIHCNSCGPVAVPEKDLPVVLPDLPDSFFGGRKGNPLAEDEKWKRTTCPKCGSAAERETDTMDTFMDSSWYFFRFLDVKNNVALVDPKMAKEGMPVDLYIGGVEHAILHLLYARFISKFLATTQVWPSGKDVSGEPFKRLISQGMVHGKTFTDPDNGRFLRPDEVDLSNSSKPVIKATGATPNVSYEKMSKSKYNGVDPGTTIAEFGVDATRAHMLFQAPVDDVLEWDEKKITGVQRWLHRVVRLSSTVWIPDEEQTGFQIPTALDAKLSEILESLKSRKIIPTSSIATPKDTRTHLFQALTPADSQLWIKTQQIVASVTGSYAEIYSLNTIISDLMTLTNTIGDTPSTSQITPYLKWYATTHLVRMLAPIAPGVAEESWSLLNSPSEFLQEDSSQPPTVFATGFPTADMDIIPLLSHKKTCVVQVDGKRKFEVEIDKLPSDGTLTDRTMQGQWILKRLLGTEEGREWLGRKNGKIWKLSETQEVHERFEHVPSGWNVIVVSEGGLCNIVSPKKGKKGGKKR